MAFSAVYDSFKYSACFDTELPVHWVEKRLGYLAEENTTSFVDGPFGSDLKTSDYKGEGIPLIQLNNIRDGKHLIQSLKFISPSKKDQLIRHVAKPGDVVIAKMADPVARSAEVINHYSEYVIVADCVKMTPDVKVVDLSFLVWAINSDYVRINAELVSTGTTRIRVNLGELKKLKIPFPPLVEQTQIANFLDHETAKIDTLIDKQQQLIALLKEKRQAVISHAVTKGLNPDAPMKDSGVEWLGEVPKKWTVVSLKHLVSQNCGIQMGPFGGMLKDLESHETGYKLYGQENTISGDFSQGGRWISLQRYEDLSNYVLSKGDIVLTRKGSLGKARLVEELPVPGIIDSDTIRVRVNSSLLSRHYLSLLMHEAHYIAEQITRTQRGSVLPGLNTEAISNLKVLLPASIDEQNELVTQVAEIITYYRQSLEKCLLKCDLLAERRTALISAAVTGKIDVRNWQPPIETQANKDTP
jgi:type I restriction enzyme, S subunit